MSENNVGSRRIFRPDDYKRERPYPYNVRTTACSKTRVSSEIKKATTLVFLRPPYDFSPFLRRDRVVTWRSEHAHRQVRLNKKPNRTPKHNPNSARLGVGVCACT